MGEPLTFRGTPLDQATDGTWSLTGDQLSVHVTAPRGADGLCSAWALGGRRRLSVLAQVQIADPAVALLALDIALELLEAERRTAVRT